MRRSVPAEQRVFSLVLALVASPQGLTKRDILSVVYGYAGRVSVGQGAPSLDRQFERDKDQLRGLGIPVESIDSPLEPGNNQLTRYRIRKQQLEMPDGTHFTAAELSMLGLAARAWGEGSLTSESRRATMKLEALGAGLDVQHLGIAPSLGIPHPAATPLQRAIVDGVTVTFDYHLPDRAEPLRRTVAPLRLHRAEGRWHLIGHDLDRHSDRVFLLSRIVGRVEPVRGRSSAIPSDILATAAQRADDVEAALLRLAKSQPVVVVVRAGTQAEARLRGRASGISETEGGLRVTFGTADYRELAIELAGFGEQLAVLEPSVLREDVIERLRATRSNHAAGSATEVAGHG